MKLLIPVAVFVLLLPAASLSQDLYFTILDSLGYNPTSLDVADFDGDGRDEIFAGGDTGLVIIDPRTHGVLYYGHILRERVTASAFFDVDGDGTKDILVGTNIGGNWLNVIWGPEYEGYYRWGGYVTARISKIYNGIRPDTANIILACGDMGSVLYNIDGDTWDYTVFFLSGTFYPGNLSFIPYINLGFYQYPQPIIIMWIEIHGFTSQLFDLVDISMCESFGEDRIISFRTAEGKFIDGINTYMIAPVYCASRGLELICFNRYGNIIGGFPDPDTAGLQGGGNPIAGDFNSDSVDDLLLPMIINGQTIFRAYDGANFEFMGVVHDMPSVGINISAQFYDESKTLIYVLNHKIYAGDISTATDIPPYKLPEPIAIDISVYPNPFNETARINLSIPKTENVTIRAVNLLGQRVDDIYSGLLPQGAHGLTWQASGLSSGVYFIVVTTDNTISARKVELLK